jgi:tetratricopeptide (TPR) repeat protein
MPAVAAALFERALAMPFTHEDAQREAGRVAMPMLRSDAEWERRFRARTRLALAEAYQHAGEANRAHAVLTETAREDPSIVTDAHFASLAGHAQLESGARQVEREFRANEPANEKSWKYWMARARYFAEREEGMNAIAAFERALSFARTERPESIARHVLQQYDEYLESSEAHERAWRLLRRELDSGLYRDDGWIFDRLARHMDRDDRLIADSGWIWNALDMRADWQPVTRLLDQFLHETPMEQRAAVIHRALALAVSANSRRMLPLARALMRVEEAAAAVPLFQRALVGARSSERPAIERELVTAARVRLRRQFDLELQRHDWRAAERTWSALLAVPSAGVEKSFDLSTTASAFVRLAEAAAERGDGADVVRFRRAAANIDRTVGLETLGGVPLRRYRGELTAFYEDMARRDPGSWVPEAALAKLHQ